MSVKRWLSKRPTRHYTFRYVRPDGEFREISVAVGRGRFKLGTEAEAQEIADRRLDEQFGDHLLAEEERRQAIDPEYFDPQAQLVRLSPYLHQSNYALVEISRS